jgi:hypothetical protein
MTTTHKLTNQTTKAASCFAGRQCRRSLGRLIGLSDELLTWYVLLMYSA